MWPFKKANDDLLSRGDKAATVIFLACDKYEPLFLDKLLIGVDRATVGDSVMRRASAELLAFALHLTERIALTRLGPTRKAAFMDSLFLALERRIGSSFAPAFRDLYNTRTVFYSSLRMPSGKNLAGTLFWEFGKLMASPAHGERDPTYANPVYPNWNPMAMMLLGVFGADFMIGLSDMFDAEGCFA